MPSPSWGVDERRVRREMGGEVERGNVRGTVVGM